MPLTPGVLGEASMWAMTSFHPWVQEPFRDQVMAKADSKEGCSKVK